jgi:hypothetical protein
VEGDIAIFHRAAGDDEFSTRYSPPMKNEVG